MFAPIRFGWNGALPADTLASSVLHKCMTPRQFLVGMTLTWAACFAFYIAVMRFLLHFNAGLIARLTVPAAIVAAIAGSVGYRRWLSQYHAPMPRVVAVTRPGIVLITAQMLAVAIGAFCAVSLLWSGHQTAATALALLTAGGTIWIIVCLLKRRS